MKTRNLLIGLVSALSLLTLPLTATAQQYDPNFESELYVGMAGGATLSTVTLQPLYADKSFQQGYEGGFLLRYIAEKHFGIETGLLLSLAGWSDDYGYLSTDYYHRSLQFIELPFLMHAYLQSGKARFFLNAGPKFSYFLSESEAYNNEAYASRYPYYNKATETYFQWGIMGNAGFEFHLGRIVYGLSGGYYYGLSDIFSNRVTDPFVTSSIQQINARLYLLFQLQ